MRSRMHWNGAWLMRSQRYSAYVSPPDIHPALSKTESNLRPCHQTNLSQFELHYPNTNDTQTGLIFSWYLLSACIRPKNGSDAVPGMCQKHIAWAPVNMDALLAEADRINSFLPEFNATGYADAGPTAAQHPSRTREVVAAAGLIMSSGTTFLLLVWSVILALAGWFAFWICPRRWAAVPLTLLGAALGMAAAGGALLKTAAHRVAAQVAAIDPRFARDPRTAALFFGFSWSIVAMLALAWVCAVVDVAIGAREDDFGFVFKRGQGGERSERVKGEGRESWWSRFTWRRRRRRRRLEPLEDYQASRERLDPERVNQTRDSEFSEFEIVDDISLDLVEKKT